jgi:hypothetical protein
MGIGGLRPAAVGFELVGCCAPWLAGGLMRNAKMGGFVRQDVL